MLCLLGSSLEVICITDIWVDESSGLDLSSFDFENLLSTYIGEE